MTSDTLVSVDNLKKYYNEDPGFIERALGASEPVRAVDDISFDIKRGETLGLVGESGCGKSTTGETILRLEDATSGRITYDDENIFDLSAEDYMEFRRNVQIVFQDPFNSLDPRMTVGQIVREPLDIHEIGSKTERQDRVEELLDQVGLSAEYSNRYPHEFSGGQRQRVSIARALALDPDFIVLDEPVSALDVSLQAQVLNLLADLQDEYGLTYLFIAHDLSVVRHISDRVAVMYLGNIVEIGPVEQVFTEPKHPYTEALLNGIPHPSEEGTEWKENLISGEIPSPRDPPTGCRFHTRCPHAREMCRGEEPSLSAVDDDENHEFSCYKTMDHPEYRESEEL